MKCSALALAASWLPAIALGADPGDFQFATGSDGATYYMLAGSLREPRPGIKLVWVSSELNKPKPLNEGRAVATYTSTKLRWSFDCGAETLTVESAVFYDATGTPVQTSQNPGLPRAVVPGSIGAIAFGMLCP